MNPCDDFYEFACGTWASQNPISADETSSGSFEKRNKQMVQQIGKILNETKSSQVKSFAVKYALDLYGQCLDEGKRKKSIETVTKS